MHFSIHPDYIRPNLKEEYRKILDFFLSQEGGVQTLIAWIPVNNPTAQMFAYNLGFEYQCDIPNSAFIARDKITIACKQSIFTKGV